MITEAQIALARRIADETIPEDSDAYATHEERMADWYVARDAALAAIQATTAENAADELSSLRERVEALEAVVERAIRQAQNIGIDSGSYYETLLAARPPSHPGER